MMVSCGYVLAFHLARYAFYYALNKCLNDAPDSTPHHHHKQHKQTCSMKMMALSWRRVKKTKLGNTPNHRDATMCSLAMFQLAVV